MCCFNKPIAHVGATRILVSPTKDGSRQITVYENVVGEKTPTNRGTPGMYRDADGKVRVGTAPPELVAQREAERKAKEAENAKNAMILPAPLKPGQKIQVLDLSKDSFDFAKLSKWFPKPIERGDKEAKSARMMKHSQQKGPLEVLEVGNYFISLAESLEDLDRIDENVFKVSPNIQQLFSKHYAKGFGFVICSFDPNKEMKAHPLGYVHDLMDGGKMFVPTRHQHSEEVHETEKFDHEIYSLNTSAENGSGPSTEEIDQQNVANSSSYQAGRYGPEAIAEAIKSEVLSPLYPPIRSFRRRIVQGKFKNDDFVFVLA